ncbi:PAS domain-containing sensor histidine kinase [Pedobacter frigiditerrae]|uniref:PAS domain-containing sensor histidine kinase n=1 Tax=Pedobacter frigiditerrae TaxID=2530452 RepID=UPI00292D1EE5|nr:PAS domain-containing sensor histidine kinase [Pedobacter frigiditerrae]
MDELNNQLFCQMGEISNDGYFIFNTSNHFFKYVNKAFANIWDVSMEMLKEDPKTLIPNIHPEDRDHSFSCYQECLEDGIPKKYEIRLMISEVEKYIRFSVFPLQTENSIDLCGSVEDITITKHNKIHIEQINAHKNITLEVLAHDLKEPLGMMRLTASAMEKEATELGSEVLKDSLIFIKDMCERNIKLVKGMINREFLKSAIIELKKERADLVWELQDVVRFYRRSHLRELKNFRFRCVSEHIFLAIDSMKFLQVINNLISNAIKFTPTGATIEIGLQDQPKSVVISVADNGIGIPDDLKPTLFDKGRQGVKKGLSGEDTGGLGMSIIKTIVELHGGVVWFDSEVGIGTTFYIELPK